MKNLKLSRPSPGLVLSMIALFVALGGTGYAAGKLAANSVGTKQIKKNAVTGAKVKTGSLAASDFKAGELPAGATGATGATGAQGPKGDKGDAGAAGTDGEDGAPGAPGTDGDDGAPGAPGTDGDDGAPGATNVTVRVSADTALGGGATQTATAPCSAGERATGGGNDLSGPAETVTFVVDSQPTFNGVAATAGQVPNGWTVKATNASTFTGGPPVSSTLVAKVICAAP